MSPKQHKWYLREWSSAWKVHWCGTKAGEALARPGRPASPMRDQVVAVAGQLAARQEDGRLSADVLRHACHVVALGQNASSWNLRNKDLDKVVAVFRVLGQTKDLAGQIRLDSAAAEASRIDSAMAKQAATGKPQPWAETAGDADRKRMLWAIDHIDLPPAYVAEICEDKYKTKNWRGLDDVLLRQFLITLKCRVAARAVANVRSAALNAPSRRAVPAAHLVQPVQP